MEKLRLKAYSLLRSSERFFKTDMVYLAKGGWWMNLGTVIISACSFLLYIAFARFLPREVYGEYQYLLSLSAIIGAFTLTGMTTAVARAVAQGQEGIFRDAVKRQIYWGILPLLVAFVGSLYYFLNGNTHLAQSLILIGFFVPLINALNTFSGFFQGKRDFEKGFYYGMGWHLPYYLALVIVAIFWNNSLILLSANLVSQVIALLFIYRAIIKKFPSSEPVSPESLSYGKHLSLMGFLRSIVAQIDNVLVFHYLGVIPLAIYAFATIVPERLSSFFKFIPSAALPKFAGQVAAGDEIKIGSRIFLGAAALAAIVGMYIVAAPFLFKIFFPAYLEAVPYSQVYSLIIILSIGEVFIAALTATRSVRELYILNTAGPLIQFGLQLGGVIFYGLWGLIVAKVLGALASTLLSAGLLRHRSRS